MTDQIVATKQFTVSFWDRVESMSKDDAAVVRRVVARKLRRAFQRSKAHRTFQRTCKV